MTRVPILMYHAVDDSPAGACVHPHRFAEQLAYLKRAGYQTIHLDELYGSLIHGSALPAKPLVITFDDGYRDNLQVAWPLLRQAGFKATIFLATGHLGSSNRWNAADGVPQRPLLDWDEVIEAAREPQLSFQPHTHSHPRLTRIPPAQADEELRRSKETLEQRLGKACPHLAYPYGDYNRAVRDLAEQAGYHTACTVQWGHNRAGQDPLALFRIGIRNQDRLADFKKSLGEPPPLWKYYWLRAKQFGRGEPSRS